MSSITVASPRQAEAIRAAVAEANLPTPASVESPVLGGPITITWLPDLTAGQLATLATIQQLAVGATLITPAERVAIQSDIDGLVTYQGLASPTLTQTAQAVKAIGRILKAILRS